MHRYVLLIDDDDEEIIVLHEAMMKVDPNIHCTWASDVNTALALLSQRSFDYILVDCNMPRIDGITGIRMIRKVPEYEHSTVFMYTNSCDEQTSAKALAAGAKACIQKEPTIDKLVEHLARLLDDQHRQHR